MFRSNTHQGKGRNDLYFKDEKGQERIYPHAEKDHEGHVRNNHANQVDVSEVESIGNSKYSEIGRNLNVQVGGDAVTACQAPDGPRLGLADKLRIAQGQTDPQAALALCGATPRDHWPWPVPLAGQQGAAQKGHPAAPPPVPVAARRRGV